MDYEDGYYCLSINVPLETLTPQVLNQIISLAVGLWGVSSKIRMPKRDQGKAMYRLTGKSLARKNIQ